MIKDQPQATPEPASEAMSLEDTLYAAHLFGAPPEALRVRSERAHEEAGHEDAAGDASGGSEATEPSQP